jgi:hypothetical protein
MNRRTSHLIDDAAGLLARGMHLFAPQHPDTTAELDAYCGLPLETLFPAPTAVPELTVERRWKLRGLVAHDVRFASAYEPLTGAFLRRHAEEHRHNHVVHARWLRHASGPPRPTFVYLHGWMQWEPFIEELTLLPMIARRLDMDVIHMQLPYHGRRKAPGVVWHGEYFWTADLVRTVEAMRQSVLDARALLSALIARGHGPVGLGGLSLGGVLTLLTSCVDPRLAFAVPIVANLDLAGALAEAPIFTRLRADLAKRGVGPAELRALLGDLGWDRIRPVIPRERMFWIAAEHDKLLTPERTRALWEAWDRPPIHWFPGGHIGFLFYARRYIDAMGSYFAGLDLRA